MPIKLSSYLYRNRYGIFCFRATPPLHLRVQHGLKETRVSLRTPDRVVAVSVARHLTIKVEGLWKALSQMDKKADKPLLKALKEARDRSHLRQQIDTLLHQQLDDRIAHLAELKTAKREAATKGYLTGLKIGAERAGARPNTTPATPLFSEVTAKFVQFKLTKNRWQPKTVDENQAIYDLFAQVNGDLPIGDIDRDVSTHHLATLQQLPPNLSKTYPGKTVAEILALKPKPMSTRNVNKYMERLSSVFKWAMGDKKYGVTHNPFASMTIEEADAKERLPFTTEDLIKLFSGRPFKSRMFNTNYSFWLIPLALYTGARLNELCQLFVTDIIEVEGVPCINIADEEEEQRLKNKNAKRIVPIHSKLIEIGLLQYVEKLKSTGGKQLFPEIVSRRDGFGATPSKWFGRYKESCGIYEKGVKVFHSFRHTFITTLLDDGISEHLIAPIVGHEGNLITSKVYWNKRDAAKRQPTLAAFKLPKEVEQLIPNWEEVNFGARPGPKNNPRSRNNK